MVVAKVGALVALTEADLKTLLLGRSSAWNEIDGMITSRRNKFGSNAAAEFEVILFYVQIPDIKMNVMSQKVVCPAILALPVCTSAETVCRPVSSVAAAKFQEWLRNCESGQLTCIVKGGRQRYRASSFGAAAFVIAQVCLRLY